MKKVFTYYELQGTHPNITIRYTDRKVAYNSYFAMKDVCEDLMLIKYELFEDEGVLLSPTIEVLAKSETIEKGKEKE